MRVGVGMSSPGTPAKQPGEDIPTTARVPPLQPAGSRRPQGEEEDDPAADRHDPHLAPQDRVDDGLAFGLGDRFGIEVTELAFGGSEAGALGDEGDDEGQDAVEV